MKASLQLNISQQLTITPQLQQAIRLLQLSTLDLTHEIQDVIDSNPLLEVANNNTDLGTSEEKYHEFNWRDYSHYSPLKKMSDFADYDYENINGTTISLREHLYWQLGLHHFSETDHTIAVMIIDAVNPDGFLSTSVAELHSNLNSAGLAVELDEVMAVLHSIQHFDPIGCAAQDLSECLLLQLSQLPSSTPFLALAHTILSNHINLLAQHQYHQIQKIYKLSEEQVQEILKLVQSLNPRPGSVIESSETEYLVPDVIVRNIGQRWVVELNNDILPKLSINNNYASLIQRANNSNDNIFLKNNLQEARWLLKSLQSRQETLLKVAECIVEYQQPFLTKGAEAMKPMILGDVANKLGLHESTVSRVTTQKFIYTPQGIFELKYFFSSHLTTDTGGECSSTAIRAIIKKLIGAEVPSKPLSDNKIAQLLVQQGVVVARRTVAKYREEMGIPPSNERKCVNR